MTNKVAKKSGTSIKLTPAKAKQFLDTLSTSGNIRSSAAVHGISEAAIENRRRSDPNFADAVDIARQMATYKLEEEARRRALHGVERDVYYKGEVVGKQLEYSDKLLTLLLQANDKDRYGKEGNKTVNVTQNISTADQENTLTKLGSFLKIDINMSGEGSGSIEGGDIVDGEYEDITEEN